MKKTFTRGFTLIELLVVIAIIGILASVVLASLNTARSKGQDANIQASINNARAQSELYYDRVGGRNYDSLCGAVTSSGAGITPAAGDLQTLAEGVDSAGGTMTCKGAAQEYRVYSPLVSNTANYYCVDNTGFAGIVTTVPSTGDFDCQ